MRVRAISWRAAWFLCFGHTLLCALPSSLFAEDQSPVTRYLECVRDDKGRDVASRSKQTAVFASKRGFRAYGVVVASHSPEETCKNTSTVYVAGPAGKFRVALQQTTERLPDGSVYDGNGIERIQWSPSGAQLLIEVSQWTWGTDSTWNTKYIVFNPTEGQPRELPITAAAKRYFAQPCGRMITSTGWLNDARIGIVIKPAKDVNEEGIASPNPSCVLAPTRISFDIKSGDLLDW